MKEDSGDGRKDVEIAEPLRTADDKVFFPGTVSVDERTANSIDNALAAQDDVQKRRELAVEEQEGDNELGDTRTSTAQKKATKGGKGSRGRK